MLILYVVYKNVLTDFICILYIFNVLFNCFGATVRQKKVVYKSIK